MALLEFVGIATGPREGQKTFPTATKRRLEIARALATEPKLLCLDEPAPASTPPRRNLMGLIGHPRRRLHRPADRTRHEARHGVTDRIVVLEFGKKIAEGLPAEIRRTPL